MGKKEQEQSQQTKSKKISKDPQKGPLWVSQPAHETQQNESEKQQKPLFLFKKQTKPQTKFKTISLDKLEVETLVQNKSSLLVPVIKFYKQKSLNKINLQNKSEGEHHVSFTSPEDKQNLMIKLTKINKNQIIRMKKAAKKLSKQKIEAKRKAYFSQKTENKPKISTQRSLINIDQEPIHSPSKVVPNTEICYLQFSQPKDSKQKRIHKAKQRGFQILLSSENEHDQSSQILSNSEPKNEKRKPGRPRKQVVDNEKSKPIKPQKEVQEKQKRRRGRPKRQVKQVTDSEESEPETPKKKVEDNQKRRRGRPKKQSIDNEESSPEKPQKLSIDKEKRKPGRPRKQVIDKGKSMQGRPKKQVVDSSESQPETPKKQVKDNQKPKRGRPKRQVKQVTDSEESEPETPKKKVEDNQKPKRGRPKRQVIESEESEQQIPQKPSIDKEKRKPGRPRKQVRDNKSKPEQPQKLSVDIEKRKPGRPKLSMDKEKRKPGRQRKFPIEVQKSSVEKQKRKPGRPKKQLQENQQKQFEMKQLSLNFSVPKLGELSNKKHQRIVKEEQKMISLDESMISQTRKPVILQKLHDNSKNKEHEKYKIVVEGINTNSFEGDIRELFLDCGLIHKVKLIKRKRKNFATVEFLSKNSLEKALTKNGTVYMSKTLTIYQENYYTNKSCSKMQSKLKHELQDFEEDEKDIREMLNVFRHNESDIQEAKVSNSGLKRTLVSSPHLIVSGFTEEVTYQQIKTLFSEYGKVVSCQITQQNEPKRQTKTDILVDIQYETIPMAQKARRSILDQDSPGNKIKVETNLNDTRKRETSGSLKLSFREEKSKYGFPKIFS